MCGLVGIAGPGINYWDLDILRELTYVSGLRGMDSTGIFQGRSKTYSKDSDTLLIEKCAFDPAFFMRFHKYHNGGNKSVLDGVSNNFFCVHTRAATIGHVTNENAHPFEFSRLVGCHNGTLSDMKYRHKNKTDSEMFINDMNARGVKAVLEDLNPSSAYAIVLYDKDSGELVFARNSQRSLWVGFNKRRPVMYYASEEWMIRDILKRNKEELLDNEVRFFEPDCIHTVHPGKEIKSGTSAVFTKEKISPKTYSSGYAMWEDWEGEPYRNTNPNMMTWRERQESKKKEGTNTNEKSPEEKELKPENKDDKKDLIESKEILREQAAKVLRQEQQQSRRLPSHLSLVPRSRVTTVRSNFNNNNKVPLYHCCACQQKMSLVEQYYATKLGEKTFIHKKCQDWHGNVESQEERVG